MKGCDHSYEHEYDDHSYCFGCGKITRGNTNIISNTNNNPIYEVNRVVVLPQGCALSKTDLTRLAARYNITKKLADEYSLSKAKLKGHDYLVLPVYNAEGKPCYWQARFWGDEAALKTDKRLKWLSCPGTAKGIHWYSWAGIQNISLRDWPSRDVVIVEGILDAIRVSQLADSVAALGTHLTEGLLKNIPEHYRVILFLDKDAIAKAVGFQARCKRKVEVVFAEKDPSEHSLKELRAILK